MSGYTAGSSQWVLRRHDQKDFFFFQQFVFQLGVFMYFIENAKIKLIIEQKFFLDRICLFQDIDFYFRIFLKKEVMI